MKTANNAPIANVRTPAQRAEAEMQAERNAFERKRAQLMRRYPGKYVALLGGQIVDHDRDDEALAARMFKKFGDAPFYLARLEETPAVYELPSPELAG